MGEQSADDRVRGDWDGITGPSPHWRNNCQPVTVGAITFGPTQSEQATAELSRQYALPHPPHSPYAERLHVAAARYRVALASGGDVPAAVAALLAVAGEP